MYRWVDHTAELELHVEGATEADLFADALAAFAELVAEDDEAGGVGELVEREIAVSAPTRAALLVAWLEELVYLADAESLVPTEVRDLVLGEDGLRATVRGRLGAPRPLVKAVTYHDLDLTRDGNRWRARVVLDV